MSLGMKAARQNTNQKLILHVYEPWNIGRTCRLKEKIRTYMSFGMKATHLRNVYKSKLRPIKLGLRLGRVLEDIASYCLLKKRIIDHSMN